MPDVLPATRMTLLLRLRQEPANDAGWHEFVENYGPHIYRWCRNWRLQDADARDLTQEILAKLSRKMRDFSYDPSRSFRGWLKTVAHHAWSDFVESRIRDPRAAGDDADSWELMQTVEAREDLVRRLEDAFDHELLEMAQQRVRQRVARHTWEAFRLVAIEGLPPAEVAPKVRLQVAMVYVAKSKVQKMLQEEIRALENPRS